MSVEGDPVPGGAPGARMWGGRFASGPEALFCAVNDSLGVDWRLVRQDIAGSVAWAEALGPAPGGAGVLDAGEVGALVGALADLAVEASGLPGPPLESGAEDVHSWVERRLIDRVGDLGKKLHTGRSRNDQVATDMRLWLKEALGDRIAEVRALRGALVDLAERSTSAIIPGYTHLQRAQPILAGHWCLAYAEMLERDAGRLADAAARADECPLGCAALAGTAFGVDREAIARRLGFARPSRNSLDAISDRDVVLETIAAASICGVHLSRLAEDVVIYTSDEFGLLRLADGVTSGSSIMPQKRNPDAAELIRAKGGRLAGVFVGFAAVCKGLPLSYNKDLQEDKKALFDAVDELSAIARLATLMIEGASFDGERGFAHAAGGYSNATDLADHLVRRGLPFREAHESVGRVVRAAIERGVSLDELGTAGLRELEPRVGDDVADELGIERVVERRGAVGGTASGRVSEAIVAARSRLVAPAAPGVVDLVRAPESCGVGGGSGGGGGG